MRIVLESQSGKTKGTSILIATAAVLIDISFRLMMEYAIRKGN